MKLKSTLLNICIITNTAAIAPNIKISVYGGKLHNILKIEDPFHLPDKEAKFETNKPSTANVVAEQAIENSRARGEEARTNNEQEQEAKKDEKTTKFIECPAIAYFGGASIEIEIKKDAFILGLSAGGLYDLSQPEFKKTLYSPSLEEKLEQLHKENKKLDEDKKSPEDKGTKAKKKHNEEEEKELKTKQEILKKEKKTDKGKNIEDSLKAQRSLLFFAGPYIGVYLSENLSVIIGGNIATKNTKLQIIDNEKKQEHAIGQSYAIMPYLKLNYELTRRCDIFILISFATFFDKLPEPLIQKEEAKPTADKSKTPAVIEEEPKRLNARNGNMIMAQAGLSIYIM